MEHTRGSDSTATASPGQRLPKRCPARKRFIAIAALVSFPLVGMLFTTTSIEATMPATAATRPIGPVALTTATTPNHNTHHLTAAEKRAAELRRKAAARHRREVAARRKREAARAKLLAHTHKTKKHAATPTTPAAVVPRASDTLGTDANISPDPNFVTTCLPTDDSINCITEEIEAVYNAQTQEGLQPIPINIDAFSQLSPADQMFVLTDLERVTRGLPPVMALTAQLDTVSAKGAVQMTDPALSGWNLTGGKGAIAWDSNWAGGLNTVGSDYFWLYSDGEGYNIDCTPTNQSGCWQHEDNILAPISGTCSDRAVPQMVMGTATATTAEYGPSEAEILVQECGGLPSDTVFTWSEAEQTLGIATT